MKLGTHTRNTTGRIHKERADSKMSTLKKEYPVLNKLNGNIKTLGGAEKSLKVDSLSKVLAKARKIK